MDGDGTLIESSPRPACVLGGAELPEDGGVVLAPGVPEGDALGALEPDGAPVIGRPVSLPGPPVGEFDGPGGVVGDDGG